MDENGSNQSIKKQKIQKDDHNLIDSNETNKIIVKEYNLSISHEAIGSILGTLKRK